MSENIIEDNIRYSTTSKMKKTILIDEIKDKIDDIQSISTIYEKIDNQYRYNITIIVLKEEHYEDV
jgi:uncharacterized protein YdeI (YjbR/CyaY-like superfamily)